MKKMIIVIGAESTGTRFFTKVLSAHKKIHGTIKAKKHIDVLDEVWNNIEYKNIKKADSILKNLSDEVYLTRRSVPHAGITKSAKYLVFPPLKEFIKLCKKNSFDITILITTRSVIPNLVSWTLQRDSVSKDFNKAHTQYQETYKYIFKEIIAQKINYYILSMESLLYDKSDYVSSLFRLLGLTPQKVRFLAKIGVNKKRYLQYKWKYKEMFSTEFLKK